MTNQITPERKAEIAEAKARRARERAEWDARQAAEAKIRERARKKTARQRKRLESSTLKSMMRQIERIIEDDMKSRPKSDRHVQIYGDGAAWQALELYSLESDSYGCCNGEKGVDDGSITWWDIIRLVAKMGLKIEVKITTK